MAEQEGVRFGELNGGDKFRITSEEGEIVLIKLSKETTDVTATAYCINAISYKWGNPYNVDNDFIATPIEFEDDSIVEFTEPE